MLVRYLNEYGLKESLLGLGLSYGITSGAVTLNEELYNKMLPVAQRLAFKNNGENKFLRAIQVVLDVNAPFYFWKQFDTYKVGTVTQSESTMHTILAEKFSLSQFQFGSVESDFLFNEIVNYLNQLRDLYFKTQDSARKKKLWMEIIKTLPSSWIQRRIVSCNYAVLQNIIAQRSHHKLGEWQYFINVIIGAVKHPEFLKKEKIQDKAND